MSTAQLIDTIMINPTVLLQPSGRDTGLTATYSFQPLSNLVYTRDQQITTCRGIVMGRLRSLQRQLEVDLMAFCFEKLGKGLSMWVEGVWEFLVYTQYPTSHTCTPTIPSPPHIGLPVLGRIEAPGYLEGGDFFPAGHDLALVGIGLRSNMEACQQLMDQDMLGANRFAVVRDDFEQHQVRVDDSFVCVCGGER